MLRGDAIRHFSLALKHLAKKRSIDASGKIVQRALFYVLLNCIIFVFTALQTKVSQHTVSPASSSLVVLISISVQISCSVQRS